MTHRERLPDLDKSDYKPLYVQLSNLLADYIRRNNLGEGDLIPSENELLNRYQVSRGTIRQAMQHLEAQDVIHKVRGRGTFVSPLRQRKRVKGFQNLEETFAKEGMIVSNELLQFEKVSPPPDCASELHIPREAQVILIRRLKILNGKPFALEDRFLPLAVGTRFVEEDFSKSPAFDVVESHAEFEIVRIAYMMTVSPLTEAEAVALKVDRNALVLRRSGVYYGLNGNPIMYGRVTFLADKTELRFEFRKSDGMWAVTCVV
jgi:GntR family transcriptional regulator